MNVFLGTTGMTSRRQSLFSFILLLIAVPFAQAQTTIPPRHLEKIAYDPKNKKLLVFGGAEFNDGNVTFPANVQTWNGKTWAPINAGGPGNRVGHSWIYHDKERVTYLVSGISNNNGEHVMRDSWKWNGTVWSKVGSDIPMKTSDGAYDNQNNRLLLLGDVFNKDSVWAGGPQKIELWEFRNGKWKQLSADGPQPDGPYEVAYNKQTHALVVPTWEHGKSVVWEWHNDKWNKIIIEGESPERRNRFALAFDDVTKAVYMFGGRNDINPFFSDFWKWDGTKWEKIVASTMPQARAGATMESRRGDLILYGGVIEKGPCNEMWTWKQGEWTQVLPKE